MILKRYVMYLGCMTIISCAVLLPKNLSSSSKTKGDVSTAIITPNKQENAADSLVDSRESQNKHSRFIIKPSQKYYLQDPNMSSNKHDTSVSRPTVDDSWVVKPIPPADPNGQIVVNLLASETHK